MANNASFFLEATKESKYLNELINDIKNNSFNFDKMDNLNYSFSININDFHEFSEVSQYSESKLTLIYYDASIGYIRKKVYEYGYLVIDKSANFSLDLEFDLSENAGSNLNQLKCLLENYIDEFGEDESNFPTIGSYITINTNTCNDEDVLALLEDKKENIFKVKDVDVYVDGLWVEGCDYRLDILDCEVI